MKLNQQLFWLAIASISTVPLLSQKALSQECPFDSYMIIGGRCHDMTSKKAPQTIPENTYSYPYVNNKVQDLSSQGIKKECSDFSYQETAQRFFELHPEHQHLDSDRDGYACDDLIRRSNNILTPAIWRTLVYENRQRKKITENVESLSYQEVTRIIGFPPNASRGSRVIWEDPINNMTIKIVFRDGKILEMKGTGF